MNPRFVFTMIAVLATLTMMGTTMLLSQSALAYKGGSPNINAEESPASVNAEERNERFHDRIPNSQGDDRDDNENNNYGQATAHDNSSHNDNGME
jgi:hypothetical protein